ncbi:hypothetical protein [Pleurocapsa sp. PCC 7319]|uniref:hypothetical protein n=1 Tax=Pleurocapsa sp. PCC 7319 TaxID=118161 RepID=UPI001181A8DF|nr:hypothetical protein [Pleurocapsa sp. PCC 7319]
MFNAVISSSPTPLFLFGMKRAESLIGSPVYSQGWFRRDIMPWMDLIQLEAVDGTVVNSYHRFWTFLLGGSKISLGIFLGLFLLDLLLNN